MNREQQSAAMSLQRALAKCAEAGLCGGVYDATFVVWPEAEKHPHEHTDFFDGVREAGGDFIVGHGMTLDGGAGN